MSKSKDVALAVNEACPASGSEDEFRICDTSDTVQCMRCGRWFYLTRGVLPRHKTRVKR